MFNLLNYFLISFLIIGSNIDHEKCSMGKLLKENCSARTSSMDDIAFKALNNLSEEQFELLELRSGVMLNKNNEVICNHHENLFLNKFSFYEKYCCDPLKIHKKLVKSGLRIVTMPLSQKFIIVKPGQKLCSTCRQKLKAIYPSQSKSNTPSDNEIELSELRNFIANVNKIIDLL